jgi:hypothetical protein
MNTARSYLFKLIIALTAILSVTACATRLEVKKIQPGEEKGGLAYCLLVPKVQVITKEAVVYDTKDCDKYPPTASPRRIQEQTVSLVQVPSYQYYYEAKVHSGWFTTDSYQITYDSNGGLSTYNFTTAEQTGSAITALAGITLALAPIVAGEEPQISVPLPSESDYLAQCTSGELLKKAEDKIKELKNKIKLKKGGAKKKAKNNTDELTQLQNLNDAVSKLKALLNPTPSQIIKTEYFNLRFMPEGSDNADQYIIHEIQEAEKHPNTDSTGLIPCDKNGMPMSDFVVVIAQPYKERGQR